MVSQGHLFFGQAGENRAHSGTWTSRDPRVAESARSRVQFHLQEVWGFHATDCTFPFSGLLKVHA